MVQHTLQVRYHLMTHPDKLNLLKSTMMLEQLLRIIESVKYMYFYAS